MQFPISFHDWTFFDTNCMSELVKLVMAGHGSAVEQFLKDKRVLIPSTVLQELRKRRDIIEGLPQVLPLCTTYFLGHPTKIWNAEVWSFFNVLDIDRADLTIFPLTVDFFRLLLESTELESKWKYAESVAPKAFAAQIRRDKKHAINERKLGALVWGKASEVAQSLGLINFPTADGRPESFPSIYLFCYAYFYRCLSLTKTTTDPNDFIDLQHTILAPYCSSFYVEKSLGRLLQRQVKGRTPPTPYQISKDLGKEGWVDSHAVERARRSDDTKRANCELLPTTAIRTFTEMRLEILGDSYTQ